MKVFWLLPFVLCSRLVAQEVSVVSSATISLVAKPLIPRQKEQAAIKSLLELERESRRGNDAETRQKIAVSLARLGMTEKALELVPNGEGRIEVQQTVALRSICVGTVANARRWINQIPLSQRAYAQLQLARRLCFEGHKGEALEVLRQIPFVQSIQLSDLSTIKIQSDAALTAAQAGDKAACTKRFAALSAAVLKLSKQGQETREQAESDFGFVIFNRLKAGTPVTTAEIVAQGRFAPLFAIHHYISTQQETQLRAVLAALPIEAALADLLECASLDKRAEPLRRQLVREWLAKTPEEKREEFVQEEARSLVQSGELPAAMEFIDAVLSTARRQSAQEQLRFSILTHPEWYFRLPLEVRQKWGKPLLRQLQIQKRQQQSFADSENMVNATLTQIFRVAVAIGESQTAQNALYEREKLSSGLQGEEDAQIEADLYAADWKDAGNPERAAKWRKRADALKSDEGDSPLERVRSLLGQGEYRQAALLLPQVTTAQWNEIESTDLYNIIAALESEVKLTAPPLWLKKLSPSQQAEALYQWSYLIEPWETMSWEVGS